MSPKGNAIASVFMCSLLLLAGTSKAGDPPPPGGPGGDFDVCAKYGAKPDSDITDAVAQAWKDACAATGPSKIIIPLGTYLLREIVLTGPCNSPIEFQLDGCVKDPGELISYKEPGWITFEEVTGLTVSGKGSVDGQGPLSWGHNECKKSAECKQLPLNIRFDKIFNGLVKDITSIDSKNFHINLCQCDGMVFQNVHIKAPADSPNTDGIHMGRSKNVVIMDSTFETGDDCISIGHGSVNITILRVKCGPGHGLSIGSLGKEENEMPLQGIVVKDSELTNTDNGVRIKSWPGSFPGSVTDVCFENIIMNNVNNPVIIDQMYCPHDQCTKGKPSQTQITNVLFKNIKGTSANPEAVQLLCDVGKCVNVELCDIDLQGPECTTICQNVKPKISGVLKPPGPTCA